ncbi:MAG: hypothetical protein HGA55_04080 [Methanoregulaceae archaeon]|nr:hypothetical protein [Methanoregulaceae archaeon]
MILDIADILVYVLLIITGISLFLFILTLLFQRELSGRIRKRGKVSSRRTGVAGERSAPVVQEREEEFVREEENDILSGIKNITGKYRLDSLIIASRDGLVVAAAGSSNPEFEAAYYTDMFTRKKRAPDNGLRLFELGYGDTPLIGIARRKIPWTNEFELQLAADIETVLREHLGQPA